MCDTLVIRSEGATWFAKNSDREPEEPQIIEVHDPVIDDDTATLRATYIDIPQVPNRFGTILSRPIWMWGAEMGVNDQGVAIGNEAVYSKLVDRKGEALLGMDLLRLGLERGRTAKAAMTIITDHLEQYGQAGPAGYADKKARYDNSFIIADAGDAWVLETAGKKWVAKQIKESWAISNTYSLRQNYEMSAEGLGEIDFKATYETTLMPWLAEGRNRQALSEENICNALEASPTLGHLAAALRSHRNGDGFVKGGRGDVCMHASGLTRPAQSTASLIVKLSPFEPPRVAATGTALPCVSLFRPVDFGGVNSATDPTANDPTQFWNRGEKRIAKARKDRSYRDELRNLIAAGEPAILEAIEAGEMARAADLAAMWGKEIDQLNVVSA